MIEIKLEYVIVYLIIINLIGILAMYLDKKKAIKGSWRIKEKTLIMISVLGGGIGALIGMYLFRHKTKKLKFTIGIPIIIICEVILICFFIRVC